MNPKVIKLSLMVLQAGMLTMTVYAESAAQFMFGTPTGLGEPIDNAQKQAPELSSDGLSLYYQYRMYNEDPDIYIATRDSVDSPWENPRSIGPHVNTRAGEASPSLSPNGRELYFSDGHREGYPEPLRPGGLGGPDNWVSLWNEETASWGEPQNLGAPLNSPHHDYKADLSFDGLELYFSSDRPGGTGSTDLWMARRRTINDPWGEPIHLGDMVNSNSHDENPTVSPDGRMLVFDSNRPGGRGGPMDLWLSIRDQASGEWGPAVHLGDRVNGTYWTTEPSFSPDGSTLLYSRWDPGPGGTLWQVPLLPLEARGIEVGSDPYIQAFDVSLGIDGSEVGASYPTGWSSSENGIIFESATTQPFPPRSSVRLGTFGAGAEGDPDRALAVGVPTRRDVEVPMLQFLGQVKNADSAALQLQFDLETWLGERRAAAPGEAAFDVSVEVDFGEGFVTLHEFSTVTTGTLLSPPDGGGIVDGNLEVNRTSFDSGTQMAMVPAGSTLRIRWEVPEQSVTNGWVFGLDNVKLQLFDDLVDAFDCNGDGVLDILDANCAPSASLDSTLASADLIKGDADGDGTVRFADFLILSSNFGETGRYTDGDFDKNGQVEFEDFLILSSNFGQSAVTTSAVPEPSGRLLLLLSIGLLTPFRRRKWTNGDTALRS